ncbi:PDGLE domain-containing protein [Methanoregula sp.]|uniref:PDGLE domain-containing protein n=1 Tax=Methanoregula sp. TaxID=2052170 RepID=UPI002BAB2EBA|nr:PDGLE domain-containing protein [Methanoregula sp.]HVP95548.1 PDGLE domain-containing protein [Methanoregula sp.]
MDVMSVFNNMDKTFKVLVIALIGLIVLVPIGLIASGTAFGEWGPDELQQAVGFVPAGLQQMTGLWSAPLDGYDLPGDHETIPTQTPGYYVSAIVGVVAAGLIAYGVGKVIIKRDD